MNRCKIGHACGFTALDKGVVEAADNTVFATNQAQGLHEFAPYPLYPGFHSLPMVVVSLNKDVWDSLPDDLKTILETSVDALAYEMVAELKTRDLEAVREARQNPDIEIIDLPAEERVAFRNIAKQEWENWAEKNEITQEFYESVVAYLENHNLL